jgi:dUTP pyrophosphatase
MYIKLTEDAKALQEILKISFIPYRATPEAAAFDLRACIARPVELYPNEIYKFPTGVHIHLNDVNRCALYLPRSSNNDLILTNTIGLLDPDYTGESFLKYKNIGNNPIIIHPGERIGQLLILNCIHPIPVIVKELNETKRSGGFGSTGKV